jgi:hypothetical protein
MLHFTSTTPSNLGFSMGYIGLKFKLRREEGGGRKCQENGVFQYFDRTGCYEAHPGHQNAFFGQFFGLVNNSG